MPDSYTDSRIPATTAFPGRAIVVQETLMMVMWGFVSSDVGLTLGTNCKMMMWGFVSSDVGLTY